MNSTTSCISAPSYHLYKTESKFAVPLKVLALKMGCCASKPEMNPVEEAEIAWMAAANVLKKARLAFDDAKEAYKAAEEKFVEAVRLTSNK